MQEQGYYEEIGRNAKERIGQQLSCGNMAEIIKTRLKEIYEKNSTD